MALLSLTLEAEGVVRLYQPRPVRVWLQNVSDKPLWIVGCVDGAQAGARYPIWRAQVEGPNGPLPTPETPDMVRPLLAVDFRQLAPGERLDPTSREAGANWFPLSRLEQIVEAPGAYRASLELDMTCEDPERWLGGGLKDHERAATLPLLAQVPRLSITSNTLEIRVEG